MTEFRSGHPASILQESPATIYENDPEFEKDGIQWAFEDFEVVVFR